MIKNLIPSLVLPAIQLLIEGKNVLESPPKRWVATTNGRIITASNGTIITAGR